mmetsp:Transcript_8426/g.17037  ORF Transcript_8426/g.17037 Transcript_8426/m.17037 type:complete len:213 (-) Transcript_8426:285-923(-)
MQRRGTTAPLSQEPSSASRGTAREHTPRRTTAEDPTAPACVILLRPSGEPMQASTLPVMPWSPSRPSTPRSATPTFIPSPASSPSRSLPVGNARFLSGLAGRTSRVERPPLLMDASPTPTRDPCQRLPTTSVTSSTEWASTTGRWLHSSGHTPSEGATPTPPDTGDLGLSPRPPSPTSTLGSLSRRNGSSRQSTTARSGPAPSSTRTRLETS